MNFYATAVKVLRNGQYSLIARGLPFTGIIGPFAYISFYFTCRAQGYRESLTLRLIDAALFVPLFFFPKNKPILRWQKWYFEIIMVVVMPFSFGYLMHLNDYNTYWFVSFMWGALIYGFASSSILISLPGFVAGSAAAWLVVAAQLHGFPALPSRAIGALSVALLSLLTTAVFRLCIDIFYLMTLEVKTLQVRADEALERQKLLEEKNQELTARNEVISMFGHQADEVVRFKTETREKLNRAIRCYFSPGSLDKAFDLINELMDRMPSHRFIKDRSMDNIILAYAYRCGRILSAEKRGGREMEDIMRGCHDFTYEVLPSEWYNIPHAEMQEDLKYLLRNRKENVRP